MKSLTNKHRTSFNSWLFPSTIAVVSSLTLVVVPSLNTPAVAVDFYQQTNLVSDIPGLAAFTDSNLVNPWGISFGPTGPFWISANGTGVSTLYNGVGQPLSLVVTIPPPGGSSPGTVSKPTGQVFNGSTNFVITDSNGTGASRFIFATEDGTISAWRSGTNAVLQVPNSNSAVYKGLAIDSAQSNLYAANFATGNLDQFGSSFNSLGSLNDPTIPAGFAPFNVQNLQGKIYVTYAKQKAGTPDDESGLGNGFVEIFNPNTNSFTRLISQGELNSPWGLAIAPADFGAFSNALLVGNFGDGKINAFNPTTGAFLGQLQDATSNPIKIDGLWGLAFGNGGNAGKPNELFFTAGINDEANGLFGKLQAVSVPESSETVPIISIGIAFGLGAVLKRELANKKKEDKFKK